MKVSERSCVPGYHIYKDVWNAVIDEELQCEKPGSLIQKRSSRYAVTVKRWDNHWSSTM